MERIFTLAEIESMKKNQAEHDAWLKEFYNVNGEEHKVKTTPEAKMPQKPTIAGITPTRVGNDDRLDIEKKYRGIQQDKKGMKTVIEQEGYSTPPQEKKVIKEVTPSSLVDVTMLTTEEFDMSSNACRTYYYYEKNGYVTDTDNNPVNHYYEDIGEIKYWAGKFSEQKTDVIYIRNNQEEIDYEIVKISDDWNDIATAAQKALMIDVGEQHDN